MTVTLGTVDYDVWGTQQVREVPVTPSASYPAGGEPFAASQVGLGVIERLFINQKDGDQYVWRWDPTDLYSGKLRAYGVGGEAIVSSVSQTITKAGATDVTTTLTTDFTTTIPAGALVLGWKAVTTVAWDNDTSAVMQVGVAGDLDRFSAQTTGSVFTTGTIASAPLAADVLDGVSGAITPRVTVTTGADATNVTAGASSDVTIYYLDLVNNTSIGSVSAALSITAAGGAPSFTDGGGATGHADFASTIPAGSLVLGWKAEVTAAPTGADVTTVTIMVGVSGDTDRFSADTSKSVAAVGTVGSAPIAADVLDSPTGAITPRVTLTEGDDFTDIETMALTVTVYYLDVAAGASGLTEAATGTDLSDETLELTVLGF